MEKTSVYKNVILGFALLCWPLALVLWITQRNDFDTNGKYALLSSLIYACFFMVLSCIPFVGWIAEIVFFVFWLIGVIKMFTGDFEYRCIVASSIAKTWIK